MLLIPLLLLGACLLICQWAAGRYQQMWQQGQKQAVARTGQEIAHDYLVYEELREVRIVEHRGVVTDYYDARRKCLILSPETAQGKHLAAWATALHEAAHAAQQLRMPDELRWRQTVIKLNRYVPMLMLIVAGFAVVFLKMPARFVLLAYLAHLVLLLVLHLGTLALERQANGCLKAFLAQVCSDKPHLIESLTPHLSCVATRELGDLLKSPRYFFFSALPGTGKPRPSASKNL
jgi:uncharacterized protein